MIWDVSGPLWLLCGQGATGAGQRRWRRREARRSEEDSDLTLDFSWRPLVSSRQPHSGTEEEEEGWRVRAEEWAGRSKGEHPDARPRAAVPKGRVL